MSRKSRDVLIVGFALFSMFLGAGNLIFPPYLGFHAGENWLPVLIGFLLTGVGLPFLGVYATLKSGGNITTLGSHVSRRFASVMGIIIILCIGPLYAIPRTAATVHEIAVLSFFPNTPSWITAVVFFGAALLFSINSTKVIDRLGKVLTPFLIITLVVILVKGIMDPLGDPIVMKDAYTFANGFVEGYQTMDALASTMFAGVALTHVINLGYDKWEDQMSVAVKAGIVGIALLGLIYGGLVFIGMSGSGLFDFDVERTTLLVGLTKGLLGEVGLGFLAVAITLACLTTAIGLIVTCGEYFESLTKKKLPYRGIVIFTSVFSGLISIIGVDKMVHISVPFLVLMYPVLMVLVIFNIFDEYIPNQNAYIGGVVGALLTSFVSALKVLAEPMAAHGMSTGWIDSLVNLTTYIPLQQYSLEWVVPVIVLAAVACFFPEHRGA